jgi:hypothetical protein
MGDTEIPDQILGERKLSFFYLYIDRSGGISSGVEWGCPANRDPTD